ncbi:MAG: hypothetical protein AB7H43_04110 [Acidimicrobiia bacterium]
MTSRTWWPAFGIATFVLTPLALAGVGDAPDPHLGDAEITAWFTLHRDAVLASAPFGYLTALAIGLFSFGLAAELSVRPAAAVRAGGSIAAGYFAFLQVAYTTLAYGGDAGGLFVATILTVPVFAIGVALLLGGAAGGGIRPRWLSRLAAAGAVAVTPAVLSFADSGWLSPDVEQQVVANGLLLWLLLAGIRLTGRRSTPAAASGPRVAEPPARQVDDVAVSWW